MADSLATIEAQLRLQYPVPQYDDLNGVKVEMTQARFDAWITDPG
jgi:hypothetical protein